MKCLDLPTVTLACVDSINHVAALAALRASMSQCRFSRVIWVTNNLPADLDVRDIDIIRCPHLNAEAAYSNYMFRELLPHVRTPQVLVQQWDGFVADNTAWNDQFLNYDYIGAPWQKSPDRSDAHRVGNGGFSLRSRRLLEALADPTLQPCHPEDVAIGVSYRPWLEQTKGITFAPLEVAELFSYEGTVPKPTFGFHGMQALSGRLSPHELARLLRVLPLITRRGGGSRVAVRSYFYRYGNFGKAQQLLAAMLANPHDYEPDDFIALTLGNSLLRLGRSSEAGAWWQNQLAKTPQPNQLADSDDRNNARASRAMVGNNLGCVYLGHGLFDLASQALQSAMIEVKALGDKADAVLRDCLLYNLDLARENSSRLSQPSVHPRVFMYPLRCNWDWIA
jgi:Protein of unknown function (DUF5672)